MITQKSYLMAVLDLDGLPSGEGELLPRLRILNHLIAEGLHERFVSAFAAGLE
jgi:hypothetical protein